MVIMSRKYIPLRLATALLVLAWALKSPSAQADCGPTDQQLRSCLIRLYETVMALTVNNLDSQGQPFDVLQIGEPAASTLLKLVSYQTQQWPGNEADFPIANGTTISWQTIASLPAPEKASLRADVEQTLPYLEQLQDSLPNQPVADIRLSQLGFATYQPKVAFYELLPEHNLVDSTFQVLKDPSGEVAFSGTASDEGVTWYRRNYSLDFSELRTPGRYRLQIDGVQSEPFAIDDDVQNALLRLLIQRMEISRCGTRIADWHDVCHQEAYQASPTDKIGHPDPDTAKQLLLQQEPALEPGTAIEMTGGWHDAGDHNRYSATTGYTLFLLATAKEQTGIHIDHNTFDESSKTVILDQPDGRCDLLDQVAWGAQWLLKVQHTDGGFFEKERAHGSDLMPEEDPPSLNDTERWPDTAARCLQALAAAARVLRTTDTDLAQRALQGAEKAWEFIEKTPDTKHYYGQETFYTGSRNSLFSAAVELYVTRKIFGTTPTDTDTCFSYALENIPQIDNGSEGWNSGFIATGPLSVAKLYSQPEVPSDEKQELLAIMKKFGAWRLSREQQAAPYDVDFGLGTAWGHNARMLGRAIDLYFIGNALGMESPEQHLWPYAEWVLGKNPIYGYSYVGGVGHNPEHIHATLLVALAKKETTKQLWDSWSWEEKVARAVQLRPTIPGWVYPGARWSPWGGFRYGYPYVDEAGLAAHNNYAQTESVIYFTASMVLVTALLTQQDQSAPIGPWPAVIKGNPPPPLPDQAPSSEVAGCGCRLGNSANDPTSVLGLSLLGLWMATRARRSRLRRRLATAPAECVRN